ncbi:MAG: ABC transporter ATP-binding protein [Pseudomonadota bacterium]
MSIRVDNLGKRFGGHAAVDAVSLSVPENAFFCVVGPSGCGKSTLLRLIAGLEVPDTGRIALDGTPVAGDGIFVPPEDRRVGVVFQSYALWPHLTVQENVAFPYEAKAVAKSEARRRADEHLRMVSLSELAGRRPGALSGGQRQRVALARALAGDTRTVLMDEPLANLDPHLRGAMEAELRAFHDRTGVTTLYITHDQREAMALADLMAVMDAGRILQIGAPREIYERPANAMVARFIGRGVLIGATVSDGRALICGQSVAVDGAGSGERTVFVRPRDIAVGPSGWPAEVVSVLYRGGYWEAAMRGAGLDDTVMLDLSEPVRPGETLHLMFNSGWVLPG